MGTIEMGGGDLQQAIQAAEAATREGIEQEIAGHNQTAQILRGEYQKFIATDPARARAIGGNIQIEVDAATRLRAGMEAQIRTAGAQARQAFIEQIRAATSNAPVLGQNPELANKIRIRAGNLGKWLGRAGAVLALASLAYEMQRTTLDDMMDIMESISTPAQNITSATPRTDLESWSVLVNTFLNVDNSMNPQLVQALGDAFSTLQANGQDLGGFQNANAFIGFFHTQLLTARAKLSQIPRQPTTAPDGTPIYSGGNSDQLF